MAKRKELDLGNSDFKSMIEGNYYYVDKSMFIREFIKSESKVVLLPRPRRFGKTLNLSMLRYYFDIQQPENAGLFKDLQISHAEDDVLARQGRHPVIFISFRDSKGVSWDSCLDLIVEELSDLYTVHRYLLDGDVLAENEKEEYSNILYKRAKTAVYERSLKKLSEYLLRYHQQKVVVLIDEYDTPIQSGYKKYYDEAVGFMRNLLSGAFKDNNSLYKGAVTGILRVSKESIFSGLNNIGVYTVLDEEFSLQFGFTVDEIEQISHDFGIPENLSQIKQWYNGYLFGNANEIYNPWSVLNFLRSKNKEFKAYWVNTSSNELLRESLNKSDSKNTKDQLLHLFNDGNIEKRVDENFIYPDLETDKELLWSLLLFSGYLTIESKIQMDCYKLKIPNYEIKYLFQNIILNWFRNDIQVMESSLKETCQHLVNNEIAKFEKGFKKIIGDTFSYFDTNGEPENVYQAYVLGLLAILGDDYIIRSNRESGEGRYDILMIPHDKSRYGVVIEIKQITRTKRDSEKSFALKVNNKIKEALNQMEQNEYYQELVAHQIEKIIQLPIVFAGKVPYMILK